MIFENNIEEEQQKNTVELYNKLRQETFILLAKFRNVRESQDYALRYKLRPRLVGNY